MNLRILINRLWNVCIWYAVVESTLGYHRPQPAKVYGTISSKSGEQRFSDCYRQYKLGYVSGHGQWRPQISGVSTNRINRGCNNLNCNDAVKGVDEQGDGIVEEDSGDIGRASEAEYSNSGGNDGEVELFGMMANRDLAEIQTERKIKIPYVVEYPTDRVSEEQDMTKEDVARSIMTELGFFYPRSSYTSFKYYGDTTRTFSTADKDVEGNDALGGSTDSNLASGDLGESGRRAPDKVLVGSTASTAATANNNASSGNHTNNNSGSGSHSNFNANSGSFSSKGQSASFSGNSDLLDRFLHSIDNDNIYKLIYLLIKEILEVVESSCNGLTGEESPVELYFVMLHKLMDNKMIVTNFMQEYLTFILHLTTMISGSSGSGGGRVGSGGGKGMEMVETYVYMLFNKLVSINTNKLGTVIDTIHDHLTTNYSVGDADRSRGGEEGSGGSSKNVWTSIIELCIGYLNNNSSSSLIKNPVEVLLILSERNVHNFVGGCLKLFGILIRLINASSGGGGASGPASMSGVQVNTSNQGATNRSRENRLNLLKLLSNLLNLNIRHYHQITSQLMLTIVKTTFESNLSRVSTESIMKLLTQAPSRTSNTLSQLFLNSKREVEDKRVVTANVLGLLTNVLDHEDLRKELLLIEKELLLSYLLSANNELTVPIAAKLAKLSEGDTTLKHSLFNTLLDLLDSKLNVLNEPDIRILLQFLDSELVFNNKFNHFISQLSDSNSIANQSFYAQIVLYAVSNTRITDKLTFDLLFSLVQRVRVSSERYSSQLVKACCTLERSEHISHDQKEEISELVAQINSSA